MTEQLVTLEPNQMTVDPGGEAVCRVHVRNGGTVVDELTATVLGPAAEWAVIEPASLRLFPKDEGVLAVRFRPPRSHTLAPGPVTFGVRVVGTAAGDPSAVVEEGTLTIAPFTEVVAVLTPRRSRGRVSARHRLMVSNRGNVPTRARLTAADPDEQVTVRFRPEVVEARPGTSEAVAVRVRPRRVLMKGSPELLPFEVAVAPTGAPGVRMQAAMDHRRVIPAWLPAALLLAAVLLIAVLVLRARTVSPVSTAHIIETAAAGGNPASSGAPNTGTNTAKKAVPPAPPAPAPPPPAPPPRPPVSRGVCPTGPAFARQTLYSADGNAKDAAGGGADAKPLNGAAYGPGGSGAPLDQAFAFTGGQSVVDLGPTVGDLGTSSFCVSMEVKTSQAGPAALVGNRNSQGDGQWWNVRLTDNGRPYLEMDNHGAANNGAYALAQPDASPINDGQWHNLTVLRVGTLIDVYVDRTLVATDTSNPIDVSNGVATRLGWDGFLSFSGEIDEVLISRGA